MLRLSNYNPNAAITKKLLDIKDEKQKQDISKKIQAQYDAQDAPGTADEEQVKATNIENVIKAQQALEKVVIDSKPGDIQDAGSPTYKLTLAKTAGGAAIAAAVSQLNASLEAVRDTVIKTGSHYNPEPLLKAFKQYDELLIALPEEPFYWLRSPSPKMQFLYRNLGRYQQMMSLGYAHGFCGDGLRHNVSELQKGRTPRESTMVRTWDSVRMVWSNQVGIYSFYGSLGVDFAISDNGLANRDSQGSFVCEFFQKLMSIKNSRPTDPQTHCAATARPSV